MAKLLVLVGQALAAVVQGLCRGGT
jgi:hypothetical protein